VKSFVIAAALLALAAPASHAARLTKGSHVVWIGLNGNSSPLIGPTTSDTPFKGDEIGLHLAYSQFLTDAWAFILSGSIDAGNDTFDPKAPGPKVKATSSSWNVRVGFDRYAFIDDRVALYAGPGVLYWKGNAKVEGTGNSNLDKDWPDVKQIGLNGRVGMYARLSRHHALFGHIGQVLAYNSSEDASGKRTFWSNQHEGSVGLAIDW